MGYCGTSSDEVASNLDTARSVTRQWQELDTMYTRHIGLVSELPVKRGAAFLPAL